MVWNKKVLDREQYVILRRLFFQKKKYCEIQIKTGLTPRIFQRIVRENNWIAKRDRYYRLVCFVCYNQKLSIKEKCNQLGLMYESVKRIKRKFGISTKRFVHNKRITDLEEKQFVDLYQSGQTGKEIIVNSNFVTAKTVYDILDKFEIDRRAAKKRTSFNDKYFEEIDSCDKAYILGLLLTDGYVIKDYWGIAIQLTISDKYILEKIATRLGESCTLINIDCSAKRKIYPNTKDMARLLCHCGTIAQNLKDLEMVRNKAPILKCPKIGNNFLSSFFRGVWDGDGSVGVCRRNRHFATLGTKSKKFAEGLSALAPFQFGIYGSDFFHLEITGGKKEVIKFWKWIYSDGSDLYLRRKYEKVQNYID